MNTPTERLNAALADRYRIERELGAGGMATVYLAEDLKHDRKVAIKVLKPELAAVLGAERFVVEIKTTAAMSHPHILPLFDSGTADGFLFYVMPYIQGETIREKLTRETQFGVDEAVRIAREVADALDYAHRHGVIHRDIKPENILLHDGRAMVMDFGIALAVSAAAGGRMTETGLSLGTPHYMSPEQATAEKEITARSDQYSLASVLYEMLAGEPPHGGGSAQQIIMKIITEHAQSVRQLRKNVPANVDAALAKALEKLPADRFESAKAFANALADSRFTTAASAPRPATFARVRGVPIGALIAAVAVFAAAVGWAVRGWGARADTAAPIRFATTLGRPGSDYQYIAISLDGRRILQTVADSLGTPRILVRDLGSNTTSLLTGTEGASDGAEFSPDGDWIAFPMADGALKKVPSRGGPATTLLDSMRVEASGIAWRTNGDMVVSVRDRGLYLLPAGGGPPERLTQLDTARKEFNHWAPRWLPGERVLIYNNHATPLSQSRIEAYDLKSRRTKVLVEGAIFGRIAPSGELLYARDAAIFAVGFDRDRLATFGNPVPVQENVAWSSTDGRAAFAVAPNGTMAYLRESDWNTDYSLVWRDRAGRDTPVYATPGAYAEPRLSPDGRWIALTVTKPKNDLWLFDVGRGVLTQLTRAPAYAFNAMWMDNRRLAYSFEDRVYQVHVIPIDGSAPDRALIETSSDKYPTSISPDGQQMLLSETAGYTHLASAPARGGPTKRMTDSKVLQRFPMFSPDGKWIAYADFGDPRGDIYIQRADGTGGRRLVSSAGGVQPRWTKAGREIVYVGGGKMMSVSVDLATGLVGTPAALFGAADMGTATNAQTLSYDVTPSGDRFLITKRVERAASQPLVVTLNWRPDLTRVSGSKK